MPWRGVDPNDSGSHWAVPNRLIPEELRKTSCQDKLNYLDNIGRIYWPPNGTVPSYKRYLDEMPGTPIDTLWDDIGGLQSNDAERTGYPTQKPLKLVERIIKASSNESDIVLDPFCGCATTCVAAEKLDRQWIGIDVSPLAARLVQERIERELGVLLFDPIHRTDIPLDKGRKAVKRYQAYPLWNAGREVQRLSNLFSVCKPYSGSYHSEKQGRGRCRREFTVALCEMQ